jgi:hypothetical protein
MSVNLKEPGTSSELASIGLDERDRHRVAAEVAAQQLDVRHPADAHADERRVDARMDAQIFPLVVLQGVGRVEVDRGEEADPRRGLAAVLHAREPGDVVALELCRRLADRTQGGQDGDGCDRERRS